MSDNKTNKNADVADTSLTAQEEVNGSSVFDYNERHDVEPVDEGKAKSTDTVTVTSVQSSFPNDSGVKSANARTNMTSDIADEESRVYGKLPPEVIKREQKNQDEAAKVNDLKGGN